MSVSHCRAFYECRFVLSGLIKCAVAVCNAYNAGAVSDGRARNSDLFSIFTVRMRDFAHLSTSYSPKRCIAMKVTLFQQDIVWGSPWENMRRAETALAEALGCGEDNASYNQEKCSVNDISGDVPSPQTSSPRRLRWFRVMRGVSILSFCPRCSQRGFVSIRRMRRV